MQHSPLMKMLGMASWLVTALASINILSGAYDYNMLMFVGSYAPALIVPILWVIGISGMISLAMLVKMMMSGCCSGCGSCPCTCNK